MKRKYIVGIDVSETNTDAVVVDEQEQIVAFCKTTTTESIEKGFQKVLKEVLQKAKVAAGDISGVFVGTTHAANALLQKKDLYRVGVLRLSGNTGSSLPPCYDWPDEMRESLYADYVAVSGGFECDGRIIEALDRQEIIRGLHQLRQAGMQSLAIVGVFSPLNQEQENLVGEMARAELGVDFPLTLSHKVGGMGIIGRENGSIINASLKKSMQKGLKALQECILSMGIKGPLHLTQNNGTILPLAEALEYPVLTLSSGPANSFLGSAKMTQLNNAIVVDVGGSSTYVGMVVSGLPRRTAKGPLIEGVRSNFPMPEVCSLALGGGSHVVLDEKKQKLSSIGPESCGKDLQKEGLSFGGEYLTLTDVAVHQGYINLGSKKKTAVELSDALAKKILQEAELKIEELTRVMSGVHKYLPVIITGGGSALFKNLKSTERTYIIPENAGVANAYGAAMAEICGTVDTVVCLDFREEKIAELQREAEKKAMHFGVRQETLRVVDLEIIPFHYLPQNLARVKITVAGKRNF